MDFQEYRKNWEYVPMNYIETSFPMHIDFGITNRCNLSCKGCPYHGENGIYQQEPCDLDFDVYKKVIDEGSQKGLCAIKFGFDGEPLLYPKIIDAIQYAKKKGIMDVQMNSNGTLLTPKICIDLIDAGLDLFILSDYERKDQWKKCKMFVLIKGLKRNPKIRVKTENPTIWTQLVDEVQYPKFYDYNHPQEIYDKSDFECPLPWQRLLIMANGDISKCSCGSIIQDKYIGKAGVMSIEDLWTSPKMKALRIFHKDHDSHIPRMCRICPARAEYIMNNK